jgi:apolipoprotein N-acyltransferase
MSRWPIALGLFAGIFFGAAVYRLRLGSRPAPWLLVPAAWVAVEYARTYLLSGFPWNQLAAAIIDIRPLVQLSAIIGPYGVGYFIVLPATLLAWIAVTRPDRRLLSVVSASVVAVFLAWLIFGTLYVGWQERRMNSEPQRRAALLQPNITQQMRWGDASIVELFIRMMAMTESAQQQGVSVVVWPESTVPLTYTQTPFFKEAVEQESARGADIILGSVAEDEADRTKLWNAAYLVTGGRTAARYDKIKPRSVRRVRPAAAGNLSSRRSWFARWASSSSERTPAAGRGHSVRPGDLLRGRLPAGPGAR